MREYFFFVHKINKTKNHGTRCEGRTLFSILSAVLDFFLGGRRRGALLCWNLALWILSAEERSPCECVCVCACVMCACVCVSLQGLKRKGFWKNMRKLCHLSSRICPQR
eukprot:TRINITY_DN1916_c1_g1_i1.p2 TRINITY_DN1916_c1_g1~~TRINITY_DN1916_c1_g1_i1.p2  ORF type:complete len:109 (-),score=4.82 TRINITY_DN1916_c1_g1_i1:199-525(-)